MPAYAIATAFAVLLMASPVFASDWVTVGVDNEGNTWLVDKESIVREAGTVRAWRRVEFKQTKPYPPNGEPIATVLFLDITNCSRRLVGVKASKLIRKDGSLITAHEDSDVDVKWVSVAPDTVVEKGMRFVCSL